MNTLTIKHISTGCYIYAEEDLRPGIHSHGGTGYTSECIGKKYLRTFTFTYDKCSSSNGWVEANITYRKLTELKFPSLSLSDLVREHISPYNFIEKNIPRLELIHLLRHCHYMLFFLWFIQKADEKVGEKKMLVYLKVVLSVLNSELQLSRMR